MKHGPASHKRCPPGSGQIRQVKGILIISVLRGYGPGFVRGCGAHLAAGHAVVEVVYANDGDVQISPGGMNKMIAPDSGNVAVTGNDHHLQIRIGNLEACCKRQRPTVSGMKGIQAEIPGHTARTSDAGYH